MSSFGDILKSAAQDGLIIGLFAAGLHLIGFDDMISSFIGGTIGSFMPPSLVVSGIIFGTYFATITVIEVIRSYAFSK
jgi:hypothetical protein